MQRYDIFFRYATLRSTFSIFKMFSSVLVSPGRGGRSLRPRQTSTTYLTLRYKISNKIEF